MILINKQRSLEQQEIKTNLMGEFLEFQLLLGEVIAEY